MPSVWPPSIWRGYDRQKRGHHDRKKWARVTSEIQFGQSFMQKNRYIVFFSYFCRLKIYI